VRPLLSRSSVASLLLLSAALAGCGGGGDESRAQEKQTTPPAPTPPIGAAPWPAPTDPLERTRLAGLRPERRETLIFHVHAHLDVFVNGRSVPVPAGLGINIKDPGVRRFQTPTGVAYGGIRLCKKPCISPLHTHDATGVIHTESATRRPNRLGQLFTEWDVRLDRSCVGGYCRPAARIEVFVDGERYSGDPANIALTDQKEIAVVVGSPPPAIPASYDFSNV
jgi:hypothetical protein